MTQPSTIYQTPFLEAISQLDPASVIFSDGQKVLSSGALMKRCASLATGLLERGFQAHDRVVLIAPPGEEFIEIIFASSMLQGIVAIIDPEMGRDNFESKLKQFNPKWIFIDSRLLLLREHPLLRYLYVKWFRNPFYFEFKSSAHTVATGRFMPLTSKITPLKRLYQETNAPLQPVQDQQLEFLVTYTSGTLAEPKGVVHTVDSVLQSIHHIKALMAPIQEVRIAAYLPHFLLLGICTGNPVFLFDKNRSPKWILRFFQKNNITTLFGPPSFYMSLIAYCNDQKILLPASLQLIILGSAPVHPVFLRQLYAVLPTYTKVFCLYGMTEHLIISTIDGQEKINSEDTGDVVGHPVSGVKLSIADDGEVLVQSRQLFSRYLHLSHRQTPHHTGDLGYFASDGKLVLNGRKKDMIIRRDTNIYPAIYEKTIKNIPGVNEAVLLGVYSTSKQDEELLLVVDAVGYAEQELMRMLRTGKYSIDAEALPDRIVFGKIPISGRQDKVDRKRLRAALTL